MPNMHMAGGGRLRRLRTYKGEGDIAPSQIRGGNFRCGPRQSPQCVLLVYKKFAENPEFRLGNFAVNLKREISNAKLKCHENPPPPPL